MTQPLVVTAGDNTYILVQVEAGISSEKLAQVKEGWHNLVGNNDWIEVKTYYITMDGYPREIVQ